MLVEDGDETVAVSGCEQVSHLVDDNVLDEVHGFFDQFSVETDVALPGVAAAPLGFHTLEKIPGDVHPQLRLSFLDQHGHHVVKEVLVPVMHYLGAFLGGAGGTHRQRDALVVDGYGRLGVAIHHREQMPASP